MSRLKTRSISESPQILFALTEDDRRNLCYVEKRYMDMMGITNNLSVTNAQVIRFCVARTAAMLRQEEGYSKKAAKRLPLEGIDDPRTV